MRILYLGNNRVGWQILKWLKDQREEVVGLVIHPPEKHKFGEEIIATSELDNSYIFDGSEIYRSEKFEAIKVLQPDVGVSALFGYILRPEFLEILPAGCINIHPALLPYNRGAFPNVWSIVDGTPAGVTMHYIDAGTDTGDIISQKQVTVEPVDTGRSLYRKLEDACIEVFKETWPLIRKGEATSIPQSTGVGTYHRTLDVEKIDAIDLDQTYTARELINIIRARTFPPYTGAYFRDGKHKVYMRLQLISEEDLRSDGNGNDD